MSNSVFLNVDSVAALLEEAGAHMTTADPQRRMFLLEIKDGAPTYRASIKYGDVYRFGGQITPEIFDHIRLNKPNGPSVMRGIVWFDEVEPKEKRPHSIFWEHFIGHLQAMNNPALQDAIDRLTGHPEGKTRDQIMRDCIAPKGTRADVSPKALRSWLVQIGIPSDSTVYSQVDQAEKFALSKGEKS